MLTIAMGKSSVIEHLWAELDRKIRKHKISNKNQLKYILPAEWDKFSSETTENLVCPMANRLKEVIKQKKYQSLLIVIRNYNNTGGIANKRRSGSRRLLSPRAERDILQKVVKDTRLNAIKLTEEFRVVTETNVHPEIVDLAKKYENAYQHFWNYVIFTMKAGTINLDMSESKEYGERRTKKY